VVTIVSLLSLVSWFISPHVDSRQTCLLKKKRRRNRTFQRRANVVTTGSVNRLSQIDGIALFQSDDRLFPVGRPTGLRGPESAILSTNIQGVDLEDFDLEQLFHGLANLDLVRARIGYDRVTIKFSDLLRPFFRDADGLDDIE
jgi:hypothetical protein